MPRIVHIALKVDDLERASRFYEEVFGFRVAREGPVRDHTSRHLTDGEIDLALIKYRSEESAEATAAGRGPCIHHLGIEVDDLEAYRARLVRYGCELISAPGEIPIKFRDPNGIVAEIVPRGRYAVEGR
ncbi:MAG TPA: VOC family protein [Thermodesulfobacteriota bacterium]|nr:VOC family protein [Thermodesulfobacteriota bacterium]